jgi:hypothetical protein
MPLDDYPTPDWLINAIVPLLETLAPQTILEPACGSDQAIVKILKRAFPKAEVVASDIVPPWNCDFLTMEPDPIFDVIISNPPFYVSEQFIRHAMGFRRNRERSSVIMLNRINFLGSKARAKWLREWPPSIYVTPRRPSFGLNKHGKPGTDATEFAWMCWNDQPSSVNILDTEGE